MRYSLDGFPCFGGIRASQSPAFHNLPHLKEALPLFSVLSYFETTPFCMRYKIKINDDERQLILKIIDTPDASFWERVLA